MSTRSSWNTDANRQRVSPDEEVRIIEDQSHGKKYILGKFLGKGGFAKCFLMTEEATGKQYAGKFVKKASLVKPKARQKLLQEIKIHRSTAHPNIVKFQQSFEDNDYIYIILELCDNQSFMELMAKRQRLTEPEVLFYMTQLLSAVRYLHRNNIIHRDLKLGNMFISNKMEVKVGDFGLATILNYPGERRTTVCGTPNYIAPEMLNGRGEHGPEVDVWSIAVIMFTMLTGKPPFETSDVKTTYDRIRRLQYSFPDHIHISENARSLIRSMLCLNPSGRPSLNDIISHPFFRSGHIPKSIPASAMRTPPSFLECSPPEPTASATSAPITTHARLSAGNEATDKENLANTNPVARLEQMFSQKLDLKQEAKSSARGNQNASPNIHENVAPLSTRTALAPTASLGSTPSFTPKPHAGITPRSLAIAAGSSTSPKEDAKNTELHPAQQNMPTAAQTQSYTPRAVPQFASSTPTGLRESKSSLQPKNEPVGLGDAHRSDSRGRARSSSTTPVESAANPAPPSSSAVTSKQREGQAEQAQQNEPKGEHPDNSPDLDEDDRGNLTYVHQALENYASGKSSGSDPKNGRSEAPAQSTETPVENGDLSNANVLWITKWVDYSNKYGLAYQLSSGIVGVFFNDQTKIALKSNNESFDYIPFVRGSTEEHRESYTLTQYPPTLQKKVTLLQYFRDYMKENAGAQPASNPAASAGNEVSSGSAVYVRKWLRTKHGMVFRLSNRNVQVNFFDHTKIILSNDAQVVTYINRNKQMSTHSISSVMRGQSSDLLGRLKYTKEVLFQLLSK